MLGLRRLLGLPATPEPTPSASAQLATTNTPAPATPKDEKEGFEIIASSEDQQAEIAALRALLAEKEASLAKAAQRFAHQEKLLHTVRGELTTVKADRRKLKDDNTSLQLQLNSAHHRSRAKPAEAKHSVGMRR